MGKIYLNEKVIDFEDTDGKSTIGELINGMQEGLLSERAAICGLVVDGSEIVDWTAPEVLATRLSGCSEIRFDVTPIDRLALGGISIVKDYIQVVREEARRCQEGLRKGSQGSEKGLRTILEGVAEIMKTLESLSRCGTSYSINLFKESPEPCYKPALDCLNSFKEAMDARDSVLAADVLEYELTPLLDDIEKRLLPASS